MGLGDDLELDKEYSVEDLANLAGIPKRTMGKRIENWDIPFREVPSGGHPMRVYKGYVLKSIFEGPWWFIREWIRAIDAGDRVRMRFCHKIAKDLALVKRVEKQKNKR